MKRFSQKVFRDLNTRKGVNMFNAIKFYRIGRWFYEKKIPIIPYMMKVITYLIFNSVVPYQTKIGKGSRFAYGGIGVVLHTKSEIGENVIIGQGVTLGMKMLPNEAPKVGNNVYIAAGSRILGNIVVGDNVIIGANSVVVTDIPSNSVVAGAPARVVRSIDKDIYNLMGRNNES